MDIKSFVFNAFYENTYLLSSSNLETLVLDPGCYEDFEKKELTDFIKTNKLKPIAIINTHCHIDHVLGNDYLKKLYNIPLWIPATEKNLLKSVSTYAPTMGIQDYQEAQPDKLLSEKDVITFGSEKLEILYAPGHSEGHLMFYHAADKSLMAGDVIFRESIGRTDLPGGNFKTLEESIKNQVYTLPEAVKIYPGHGPSTTVGHEKKHNPFVKP
ncbi:MBL fold metallo-hydrolase [Cyclobacteriaceae bacterium]|jgi:glyoxylase-like metal-dependent hydrolase (beta-lactamase superfamily II)|nr:MBL fold metallo-hydrolase [Cyclobacteriaceae bacterium]MDB4291147.1 MBL fold metallo-hydrolase [Cyclobacteriaceae bacterium]MDB4314982.1 MBL fold metallo-hydrolase [Cyclobacteriaceae bacterium]MDB9883827.1 MBL fold metallo-hydrolase [Cyclobacteriaceae bacterium]MDC1369620.1 MBL fold metallo-hydrolase [Cyclobacteriaceae bacterium]